MKSHFITDTATLTSFCERMATEPFITIDTEFLREKTYWPLLCLVQVGGTHEAAAIDPLAEGIDLAPLYALMADQKLLKIFHAARQDLEIFYKLTGSVPFPVFDTQVAAQVCGMGESVGYEALVRNLTGHNLDKTQRFTDWSQRPLTQAQLDYALGDVIYLHESYQKLLSDIQKRDRMHWIEEDMEMLHDAALYHTPPLEAWERIKFRANNSKQLGRLQQLAAWRETLAQAEDIPRTRVIRDETLAELAINPPKTEEHMLKVRSFPQHLKKEWRVQLWGVIEASRHISKEDSPELSSKRALPPEAEGKLEMLRLLLRHVCREAHVSPRLVADKDELDWLALGGTDTTHPVLHGWRYQIFGEKALAMLNGKLAITITPGSGAIRFIAS